MLIIYFYICTHIHKPVAVSIACLYNTLITMYLFWFGADYDLSANLIKLRCCSLYYYCFWFCFNFSYFHFHPCLQPIASGRAFICLHFYLFFCFFWRNLNEIISFALSGSSTHLTAWLPNGVSTTHTPNTMKSILTPTCLCPDMA